MQKPIYTFLVVKMQLIHAKADLRFLRCKNKQNCITTVQKFQKNAS